MSYWVAGTETDSQNLTQLGSSGAGDAQFGSTSGADSNDPTALSWTSGDGDHVYLPGTSGNYLSHPTWTGISSGNDFTIRIKVAATNYISGTVQTLIGAWQSYPNNSWNFYINSTGYLTLGYYNGGGYPAGYKTSTATTNLSALTNGEPYTLACSMDAVNGSNRVCTFWWSNNDGETWTSLGTATDSGNFNPIATTQSLYLGAKDAVAGEAFTGQCYWLKIFGSDLDNTAASSEPTPTLHWEASSMTQSGGADEESGASWTINRSSSGLKSTLVTRPVIVFNSAASTYLTVADHDDLDMGASDDFTVWVYGRAWDSPAGNLLEKGPSVGYYINFNDTTEKPGLVTKGTEAIDSRWTATIKAAGAKLIAGVRVTGSSQDLFVNAVSTGSPEVDNGYTRANNNPLVLGAGAGATLPADLELFAAGVLKGTSLSSDQLASLKTELDTLLGGRTGE